MRITCQRDGERNGKNYITKMLLYTRRYFWTRRDIATKWKRAKDAMVENDRNSGSWIWRESILSSLIQHTGRDPVFIDCAYT